MRFQVLGPLEVSRDGERVALGGPKQRLVLAHLLMRANEVVSADLLIDEIWGEEPPDAARASLHSYVSHLKKALGAERLVSRPPGYILRLAADELDAARFEALVAQARRRLTGDPAAAARTLRDSLAMWRGEPFADLAHELSLQAEIERLTELRLAAIEERLDAELTLGRHGELVAELERLVARNPLRERLSGQLMTALYRAGRQAEALASYHRLRSALDEQLGIEPSPAIEELQQRILNHDPSLNLQGEPLRGYRVVEQLGSGPLGVVQRAYEPQTDREVAIKVLRREVANDSDLVRRFDAEARRVARLEHPHIVPLYDWWREPDAAYLVMRLLRGGNLTPRLSGAQISSATALRWAEQVGGALSAAHRQGVTHADIRPGNVLLDGDDNAYLANFAIGYDPAHLEAEHTSAADLRYLAPERSDGGPPSPTADLYAFGVLLGELFTRAGLSAALDATVEKATAEAPSDRFSSVSDLLAAIRRDLLTPARDDEDERRPPPTRNPYKGLRAFEEADAADFFGREELVNRLLGRLAERGEASRLLVVVGPSGSGKSSLVSAGLIPALREGRLPGSDKWFIVSMTPGERPLDVLEQALRGIAVGAPPADDQLLDAHVGLGPLVAAILPPGAQLLLLIDQFEELFTLVADEGAQDRFLQLIAATISDASAPVRVLVTLRADFYDRPLRHEQFGRQLAARTQAVPPLAPAELEQVISGPAERAGLQLEVGLIARIAAEMSEQPGALPLLQYTLSELWERRDGRRLSLRAYEASGGLGAAVGRRAEELVRSFDAEGREATRQLFLRLVEPGEGTSDTARRMRHSELQALPVERDRLAAIVDSFVRYRLLLVDRDPESRQPTLELAHEALLRAWPRLQHWVDEAREDLRQQRRLAHAAAQWLESERDPSFLLTGSRFEQAEQWAAGTRVLLAPTEREYLAAGTAERQRVEAEAEQRRLHEAELEQRAVTRLRALVVALSLGALLAGALSVYAFSESQRAAREARLATARELAAASFANLDVDPERSILLALEAVDVTRSVDGSVLREAEEVLHRAVRASRLVRTVPHGGYGLAVTSDGSRLATGGSEPADNTVVIWDTHTGEELLVIPDAGPGRKIFAFNPDDRLLATADNDGVVRLWDTQTGRARGALPYPHEASLMAPAFSPDGNWLAVGGFEQSEVLVWEVESGVVVEKLVPPDGGNRKMVFSPDGSRLATAHYRTGMIWDLAGGEPIVLEGHDWAINQIAFSPDGERVATASSDATIRIWDAHRGAHLETFFTDSGVLAVVYSPDGKRIASGGSDSIARIWDAETGKRLLTLAGHASEVHEVAFVPTTNLIATTSLDGTTRLWDIGPAGSRDWLTIASPEQRWADVTFHPDGTRFALPGGLDGVTIHDDAGEELLSLGGHQATITRIAFSPDGSMLAGAAGTGGTERAANKLVPVWDVESGRLLFDVVGSTASRAVDVAFSPDGRWLATAGDDGVLRIWNPSTGEQDHVLDSGDDWTDRIAFSPDGGMLAAAGGSLGPTWRFEVSLFDTATWHPVSRLDVHDAEVPGLAFSPDGQLVTASFDGLAKIWDVAAGEVVLSLRHDTPVIGLAISRDGRLIATGAHDGTARLWDGASGRQLMTFYGHTFPVVGVDFSPDGRLLATSSPDGTTALHLLAVDEFIELAHTRVTRALTDDECRQYLHLPACPESGAP